MNLTISTELLDFQVFQNYGKNGLADPTRPQIGDFHNSCSTCFILPRDAFTKEDPCFPPKSWAEGSTRYFMLLRKPSYPALLLQDTKLDGQPTTEVSTHPRKYPWCTLSRPHFWEHLGDPCPWFRIQAIWTSQDAALPIFMKIMATWRFPKWRSISSQTAISWTSRIL